MIIIPSLNNTEGPGALILVSNINSTLNFFKPWEAQVELISQLKQYMVNTLRTFLI